MEDSLRSLLEKLELNEDNGLFLKGDDLKINSRIKNSLKYIDYDAIYILDENPLIIFKEYDDTVSTKDIKNFVKEFGISMMFQ